MDQAAMGYSRRWCLKGRGTCPMPSSVGGQLQGMINRDERDGQAETLDEAMSA